MNLDALRARHRRDIAEHQMIARQHAQTLEHLEISARAFEQFGNEDALTGLTNQRGFELVTTTVLESGMQSPHVLALIGIDQFANHDSDTLARLAGGEFAILLRGIGEDGAVRVCARIRDAVARHEWEEIVPGLAMNLRMDTAALQPGGKLDALARRAAANRDTDEALA
jgi:PleD family two-component response regulator